MAHAHWSARRVEVNDTRKPSPIVLISRPPKRSRAPRTTASWLRTRARAAASPRRLCRSVDPSMSVMRTVTGPSDCPPVVTGPLFRVLYRLGGEALAQPAAAICIVTPVAEAVVQPVFAVVPELDGLRCQAVAAPERGLGHFAG